MVKHSCLRSIHRVQREDLVTDSEAWLKVLFPRVHSLEATLNRRKLKWFRRVSRMFKKSLQLCARLSDLGVGWKMAGDG